MSRSRFVEESPNMIRFVLSFLLLSSFAIAQEKSSVPANRLRAAMRPVLPLRRARSLMRASRRAEPVITINGVCPAIATTKTPQLGCRNTQEREFGLQDNSHSC